MLLVVAFPHEPYAVKNHGSIALIWNPKLQTLGIKQLCLAT